MKDRNYGIDALRIVSMFMVVILHLISRGGIMHGAVALSSNYWIACFLEITCYCAVNVYALISGYVMHDKNIKFSNLINLWFEVLFYSFSITLVIHFIDNTIIDNKLVLSAIFPVSFEAYWYFTAYFALFLFIPFLNKLIKNFDIQDAKIYIIISTILFCFLPIILQSDLFKFSNGYSFFWLINLFIIGALIKKYDLFSKISK